MADYLPPLYETNCPTLKLIGRGKVRDIYDFGDRLLLVATDRLSAFDCILPNPIPNKGHVLTYVSKFWFERTRHIVPSHFISCDFKDFPKECEPYRDQLEGRSTLARKAKPMPVECVMRGYLHGSAVKDYKATGMIAGIRLPEGLEMQSKLPQPAFTPATKAASGHDENITFERVREILGDAAATFLRDTALKIYQFGHDFMSRIGITLVDTKFEFGQTETGEIILIDECMTPDSSRYYESATYKPGMKSVCYDKQQIRDYLETLDWGKTPPAPSLPEEIVQAGSRQYTALLTMLEECAAREATQSASSGSPASPVSPVGSAAPHPTSSTPMRPFNATVAVTLKPEVFDVQGQTILQALGHMRYDNIRRLRAGKWFEIQMDAATADEARAQIDKISHDLLSNPVIEAYKIDVKES